MGDGAFYVGSTIDLYNRRAAVHRSVDSAGGKLLLSEKCEVCIIGFSESNYIVELY